MNGKRRNPVQNLSVNSHLKFEYEATDLAVRPIHPLAKITKEKPAQDCAGFGKNLEAKYRIGTFPAGRPEAVVVTGSVDVHKIAIAIWADGTCPTASLERRRVLVLHRSALVSIVLILSSFGVDVSPIMAEGVPMLSPA